MPAHHGQLTEEESAAVAQAMARYLTEPVVLRGMPDDPDVLMSPVVPGEVRRSRSGAPWVSFDPHRQIWHRLMDIPRSDDPADPYEGGRVVYDPEGRPLGNAEGPLILARIGSRLMAHTINTGWNLEHEIRWPETPTTTED